MLSSAPPPGCFSSMPNGPFLWSPHKTHILAGEPGATSSHLRSAAGTVMFLVVIMYLISSSIDLIELPRGSIGADLRKLLPYINDSHGHRNCPVGITPRQPSASAEFPQTSPRLC